jgi:hypothetical protein
MRLMSSPVGRKFSHLASLEESWAPSWRGVRCHLGEPAPRATNWSKITPTWRASNSIRCELAHQRCVSKRATGLIISALSVCNSISQLLERAPLSVCVHPLSWYIDHHLSISVCGVVNTWVITETLSNIDLSWKSKQRQRAHSLWHAVLLERGASCTIHYTHTHATYPHTPQMQLKYFNKLNARRLLLRLNSLIYGRCKAKGTTLESCYNERERERLTLLIVS